MTAKLLFKEYLIRIVNNPLGLYLFQFRKIQSNYFSRTLPLTRSTNQNTKKANNWLPETPGGVQDKTNIIVP